MWPSCDKMYLYSFNQALIFTSLTISIMLLQGEREILWCKYVNILIKMISKMIFTPSPPKKKITRYHGGVKVEKTANQCNVCVRYSSDADWIRTQGKECTYTLSLVTCCMLYKRWLLIHQHYDMIVYVSKYNCSLPVESL